MKYLRYALVAAALTVTAAPHAFADDDYGMSSRRHHGGGGKGAPLPVVGAGLPLLAVAGAYYMMRKRNRD